MVVAGDDWRGCEERRNIRGDKNACGQIEDFGTQSQVKVRVEGAIDLEEQGARVQHTRHRLENSCS
jgi:hypothetical protein